MNFSAKDLNPQVLSAEYAVRGELVIKADKYRTQLAAGDDSLPFKKIIACNIGNPQELKQAPLSYIRQVVALCHYPELMTNPVTSAAFPKDVIARAQHYLSNMSSTGSYTHSKGLTVVRKQVADFVHRRDGYPTDPESFFLTDGASSGVKQLLSSLIRNPTDGVLCPIPQYPLYSATLALLNGRLSGYYLDESNGWGMDVKQLQKSYDEAVANGTTLRAIVIISPGNPTGQCMPDSNMREIVKFCEEKGLVILADEVYQENIYGTTPFTSFRKVVKDMKSEIPLVSFHSGSKGVIGECGARAGYFQLTNFPTDVSDQLYKLASISLCSNVTGQLVMGLLTTPPVEGEESYPQFMQERSEIFDSLKRRADKLGKALNQMEGVSCQQVTGALYAFPSITLSSKAIQAAQEAGKAADTFYCLKLLDATGITVVPGSGFKQVPGTFHYRTTILPSEQDIDDVIQKIGKFHADFMDTYRA